MSDNLEIVMDIDTLEIFDVIDLDEDREDVATDTEILPKAEKALLYDDLIWRSEKDGVIYDLEPKNKHGSYPSHYQSLYRDLQLSIIQYQHDKIDFFKTYGDQHEDMIDDIRLIYETDHTVTVQFNYQGQPSQLVLSKEDIPQACANQELVVIARYRTIVKDDLAEYLSLFDIRDLIQEYQSILERSRLTEGFLSKDDILRLSEAPDKPLVSFHLALITQPKETEVSQ